MRRIGIWFWYYLGFGNHSLYQHFEIFIHRYGYHHMQETLSEAKGVQQFWCHWCGLRGSKR